MSDAEIEAERGLGSGAPAGFALSCHAIIKYRNASAACGASFSHLGVMRHKMIPVSIRFTAQHVDVGLRPIT